MKRNIIILLFLAFVFGPFIACEEEEQVLPKKDWFIAFESPGDTISKSSTDTLKIPVYVAAGAGASVTVNIGINADSTTATAGEDYELIYGTTLSYANGAGFDTIRIRPIAPGNEGVQTLWLFLENNSAGYNMGFKHGEEADSTSFADYKLVIR